MVQEFEQGVQEHERSVFQAWKDFAGISVRPKVSCLKDRFAGADFAVVLLFDTKGFKSASEKRE